MKKNHIALILITVTLVLLRVNIMQELYISLGVLTNAAFINDSGSNWNDNRYMTLLPHTSDTGINSVTVKVFDNVSQMKKAGILENQTVATKGYYRSNDDGGGFYRIRKYRTSDIVNNGSLIALDNGNVAELDPDRMANVKQFGAMGDGITDDTQMIQNAINFIESQNGGTVFFPVGQYKISDTLTVSQSYIKIKGIDSKKAVLRPTADMIVDAEKLNVKWTLAVVNNNKVIKASLHSGIDKGADRINIDNSSGIEPGMLVYICGRFRTSPWTSNNRGNQVKGETNKVLAVHGNTVHLVIPTTETFERTEEVIISFVKPLEGIVIEGLGISCPDNCPEDARQYRGFSVKGCNQAIITECYGNGCGSSCFESIKSYKTIISKNVVKNAWSYKPGSMEIYGLGYGLRACSDSLTEIVNNEAKECRHCVDVSGWNYPSHGVLVANNSFKSAISRAGVMSTHGPAEGSVFKNNVAEGPVSFLIRGENNRIHDNILKGKVKSFFGRNNSYENNQIFDGIVFRQEDTIETDNFNIIKDNTFFIKTNGVIYLEDGEKPFIAAYGWHLENNDVVILQDKISLGKVYMFNISKAKSDCINFGKGFVFKSNKVHYNKPGDVRLLDMCSDMSRIQLD